MSNWEFAATKGAESMYVFSAKSAPFTLARRGEDLLRAKPETWSDAPGYRESAPLAVNRWEPTVMPKSTFGNQRPSGSDHSAIL